MMTQVGRSVRQLELCGQSDELRERSGLHLSHDFAAVRFHRDLADTEFVCDLLIEQTRRDEHHDLPLPTAQRRMAPTENTHVRLLPEDDFAMPKGVLNGIQQQHVREWFCQNV